MFFVCEQWSGPLANSKVPNSEFANDVVPVSEEVNRVLEWLDDRVAISEIRLVPL